MTIHRIRRPVAVAVPSAELLRLSQRSMHDRPDCQSARDDGAFRAALFLQSLADHGAALTADQVAEMFRDMTLEEIMLLPPPGTYGLSEESLLAVARFVGFCETVGVALFRHYQGEPS